MDGDHVSVYDVASSSSTTPSDAPAVSAVRSRVDAPLSASRAPSASSAAGASDRSRAAVADDHLAVGVGGDPRLVGDQHHGGAVSRAAPVSSCMTRSPLSESSAPVGSSANTTRGPVTSARATATRCPWPPDTSPGSFARDLRDLEPLEPLARLRAAASRREPEQPQRQRDVLRAAELGHEPAELEDEAELGTAQALRSRVGQRADRAAVEDDLAGVGRR